MMDRSSSPDIVEAMRASIIEECAKIAEREMENAISRGRVLDKRSRDHAKEVAREYVSRSIAFKIRAISREAAALKCECGKPDNVSCYNPDCARPA